MKTWWIVILSAVIIGHIVWYEMLTTGDRFDAAVIRATELGDTEEGAQLWLELLEQHREAYPDDHEGHTALLLEWADAAGMAGNLPDVIEGLEQAVAAAPDSATEEQLRARLAQSHYHAAWLLRRDGANTEDWLFEAERARQHFRLLASSGDRSAQHDLETVIAFERTDASLLQGLALPKNCPGKCDNLSKRRREQRKSRSDGQKKKEGDARQQIRQEQSDGASENAHNKEAGS